MRRLTRFRGEDRGSMTVLSLYFLAGVLTVSAFAVDFAYLLAARNQLQVAADAAGHAALYYRERNGADASKLKAIEVASYSMPQSSYGTVLRADDIQFGHWSYANRTFTVDESSLEAVRVRPGRSEARGNPVTAYLFRIMDRKLWDLTAQAVFVTFDPHCLREGFVAEGVVDIQSNNGYEKGFCVHSNDHVSVNSNNTFEAGTVVSMPDSTEIDLPRSGFATNEGLKAALRNGYYRLRVLNQLEQMHEDLYWASGRFLPSYIESAVPVTYTGKKIDGSALVEGRVHRVNCSGNSLTVEPGTRVSKVVIVTDCAVKFGNGVVMEDSVIFSRSEDIKSITAAEGLQIGKDDNCAEGGGAQIITYGGMDVPAAMEFYGGKVIARKDVQFAANAGGIEGASIISGGVISGTSNMQMGFCGTGMEDPFSVPYFRLAY